MNITIDTEEKVLLQKPLLPPLTKQSSTYKLIVPAKVEEKIRYLCRKFPTLEWSGVLFYRHTGSFEEDNLVVICQDIYPMDLGSATYTEYSRDPSVTSYIVDNIDLFDCDMSLIHSHNRMQCWFSGTDLATLRSEGNDQNCFVSLIVNNEGTYCAAITRKVTSKTETQVISSNSSYEFFGEGTVATESIVVPSETIEVEEKTEIQYFMLDVEREEVSNPLDYLDRRFEEIESKKQANRPVVTRAVSTLPEKPASKLGFDYDEDKDFYDWIHSNRNAEKENPQKDKDTVYSPTLFDKETMDELIDLSKWEPDPTIIHYLAIQLITCSLIVSKDLDLKQWVTRWMTKKYEELFGGGGELENWADPYVEFIVNHYDTSDVPMEVLDDYDEFISKVAESIIDELNALPTNPYIELYKNKLTLYII